MNNWIKERQNKDNMWNLIFWFFMTIALCVNIYLPDDKDATLNSFVFWSLITGTSFSIYYFRKTSYVNGKFLNKDKQEIKNYPKIVPMLLATVAIVLFLGNLVDKYIPREVIRAPIIREISNFIFMGIVIFIPTFSFIIYNCPISIIFNKKAWSTPVGGNQKFNHYFHRSSQSSTSYKPTPNTVTDPSYSYLRSNIYNRHNR